MEGQRDREERQPADPTRKLLKVFGVKVTDYETKTDELIAQAATITSDVARAELVREAVELTADLAAGGPVARPGAAGARAQGARRLGTDPTCAGVRSST